MLNAHHRTVPAMADVLPGIAIAVPIGLAQRATPWSVHNSAANMASVWRMAVTVKLVGMVMTAPLCVLREHTAPVVAVAVSVGTVLTARIKKDSLVPDQSDQILHWTWATVSLVVVATVSIGLNVWLTSLVLKSRRDTQSGTTWRRRSRIPKHPASKIAVTGERLAVYAGHKSRECVGSSDADEETAFFDKTHGHSATP
ncbi:hypothetical protein BaRGS_00027074 [Batillaria attramentaria]|uniref:Uncharacterized protein n=1 Tax=Batillaria attramentaria TaxID=370345 RepID=A0ABD0K314_9CAEN